MTKSLIKRERGFTLIEIVLVLAIAGLILLIVFLALSGAQKARRDNQRKNDASAFVSSVESWASNNGGTYPVNAAAAATDITAQYFSRKDPSTGGAYTIVGAAPTAGQIEYQGGAFCPNVAGTPSANNYAVTIYQEQGGSFCVDNH